MRQERPRDDSSPSNYSVGYPAQVRLSIVARKNKLQLVEARLAWESNAMTEERKSSHQWLMVNGKNK